jgi:hypothetical protein
MDHLVKIDHSALFNTRNTKRYTLIINKKCDNNILINMLEEKLCLRS